MTTGFKDLLSGVIPPRYLHYCIIQ